jgi:chromate reductase
MSRIIAFAGSTRVDSFNRKLVLAATKALKNRGLEVDFADLREYPMPLYDGDQEVAEGMPATAKALKEVFRAHDGYLIASPEYNGSYPAVLKNTIDWISRPEPGEPPLAVFRGKTAAIMSTSPGSGGGRRVLKQLRELLEGIGVSVIPAQVAIPRASEAFDAEGNLARPDDAAAMQQLATELKNKLP